MAVAATGAIAMRLAAELRARWASWLALATIIGIFAGLILTAASGARRTASSYDRFLEKQHAWDAVTFYAAFDPAFAELRHEDVAKLSSVVETVEATYFEADGQMDVVASDNPAFARTFNVAKLVEGRLPEANAVNEVSLPLDYARAENLGVGDEFAVNFQRVGEAGDPGAEVEKRLEIVGVHVAPGDFPPGTGEQQFAIASEQFHRDHVDEMVSFGFGLLRLENGQASIPQLRIEMEALADGKVFFVMAQQDQTKVANESLGLLTSGLWALAAALAVVAILAFGQALSRQVFLDSHGFVTLRALGIASSQLLLIGLARAALIGTLAAIVAAATNLALSPLTPVGIARIVEPDPGFAVDTLVLLVGIPGILFGCLLLSLVPALRAEHRVAVAHRAPMRRSRIARLLFRAGGSPALVSGVRLALERGRGAGSVPVLTTIGTAGAGIAALVMAASFAASLDHLLAEPDVYGVRWDYEIQTDAGGVPRQESPAFAIADAVRSIEGVEAAGVMDLGVPTVVDGHNVAGIVIDPAQRDIAPTLLEGRDPMRDDEVVLGERTMREIGKAIGDEVTLGIPGVKSASYEIVGTAALPGFATGEGLGEGVLVLNEALTRLVPDPPPPSTAYVRFAPGADRQTVLGQISALEGVFAVEAASVPSAIQNLRQVRDLPSMIATVLAVLAIAAIAHALVSSVRRRRRELAILRALGFVRRQVAETVAWQAVVLVLAALLIGVPLGIASGGWIWEMAADRLGIVSQPKIAWSAVGLGVPAAIALGLAVSAWPARRAALTRPALVLRSE